MKIKLIIVCCLLCTCLGCWDILSEKQYNIVGNLSLINPQNQEDFGYKIVFYSDGINKNILNDYVINITGDDTVLVVKCVERSDCTSIRYYKIDHNRGLEPIIANVIAENAYSDALKSGTYKYRYHFEMPMCK